MASDPPKVFISYSHDSKLHAARVLKLANDLRRDGIEAIIDQYFTSPPEGWPAWMDAHIREDDFVIMVCSETYYRRVVRKEAPAVGHGVAWEGNLIYNHLYKIKGDLSRFVPVLLSGGKADNIPEAVSGASHYFVEKPDQYAGLLRHIFKRPAIEMPPIGARPRLPTLTVQWIGTLHGVPELPQHFLPRPDLLRDLKQNLLATNAGAVAVTGVAARLGVQGMGGIGKSVLAAALARDDDVRRAFPDGIYWLAIGQTPNIVNLQGQLVRQLTGAVPTFTTEQEGNDVLREALEGRLALVVLDDVWNVDHAATFAVTAPPARLLVTTRNTEVLVGLGADEHCVDVLSPKEALQMLADWTGQRSQDTLPPQAPEMAKKCGYLPLALAMIGAMVRSDPRPTAWQDVLTRLERADLDKIKRIFPGYPYPDLLRAIDVSLEGLETFDRERYLDMAVFPEDLPIPEAPLRILWNVDEVEARDCMARFVARSLATWSRGEGGDALVLHDLQRDLIRKRREKELQGLHRRLLEGWGDFLKLPDTYAWHWAPWHMKQAGSTPELRQLLFNFEWLQRKLDATDLNALIDDFDLLPNQDPARTIRDALWLSAYCLFADKKQLPSQLLGRLRQNVTSDLDRLIDMTKNWRGTPWLRPLRPTLYPPGGPLLRVVRGYAGGHTGTVRSVAMDGNGRWAISAGNSSNDGNVIIWDLRRIGNHRALPEQAEKSGYTALTMTNDGTRALTSYKGELRAWKIPEGKLLTSLVATEALVTAVAIADDGRRAIIGVEDGTVWLWRLLERRSILLGRHEDAVGGVGISPDGRRAFSASISAAKAWDLEAIEQIGESPNASFVPVGFSPHTFARCLALSPDGRTARWAGPTWITQVEGGWESSRTHSLRAWNIENSEVTEISRQPAEFLSVAPDGRRALAASSGDDEAAVALCEINGECRTTLLPDEGRGVSAVAISRDGRWAVTADFEHDLRLWDLDRVVDPTVQSRLVVKERAEWLKMEFVKFLTGGPFAVFKAANGELMVWDHAMERVVKEKELSGPLQAQISEPPTPAPATAESGPPKPPPEGTILRRPARKKTSVLAKISSEQRGHTAPIQSLVSAPGDRWDVSVSEDGTARVWDRERNCPLATFSDETIFRNAVWSPDGLTLAVVDKRRTHLLRLEGIV